MGGNFGRRSAAWPIAFRGPSVLEIKWIVLRCCERRTVSWQTRERRRSAGLGAILYRMPLFRPAHAFSNGKRFLHRLLRWSRAVAAARSAFRRGKAQRRDREHRCALSRIGSRPHIRADGSIPPGRTALVLTPDRRGSGKPRQGLRRCIDGARARAVRSRSCAGISGILKYSQYSVLPAPRL